MLDRDRVLDKESFLAGGYVVSCEYTSLTLVVLY